jgi:hypothetical protein
MLLLGEGVAKNAAEGVLWLECAGELGESSAFRLLVDCYENGYFGVPVNAAKAALWRSHLEEYERLHPYRRYSLEGAVGESSLVECLWGIDGVSGVAPMTADNQFSVGYDPALITPAQLDEKIRAVGLPAIPLD